jgi:hypothetical protein
MSKYAPKAIGRRLKAHIEPQLHWKVPQEAGEWATDPRWSNKGKSMSRIELEHGLTSIRSRSYSL